jgi:hypothetical protein
MASGGIVPPMPQMVIRFEIPPGASLGEVSELLNDLDAVCKLAQALVSRSEINRAERAATIAAIGVRADLAAEALRRASQSRFPPLEPGKKTGRTPQFLLPLWLALNDYVTSPEDDLSAFRDTRAEAAELLSQEPEDATIRVTGLSYNSPFQIALDVAETVRAVGLLTLVGGVLTIYHKHPERGRTRAESRKADAEANKANAEAYAIRGESDRRTEIHRELLRHVRDGSINLTSEQIESALSDEAVSAVVRLASITAEVSPPPEAA